MIRSTIKFVPFDTGESIDYLNFIAQSFRLMLIE